MRKPGCNTVTAAMTRFRLLSPSGALSIIYRAEFTGPVSLEKGTRRESEASMLHAVCKSLTHNFLQAGTVKNPIALA
jgi:hypothetical protein